MSNLPDEMPMPDADLDRQAAIIQATAAEALLAIARSIISVSDDPVRDLVYLSHVLNSATEMVRQDRET